MGIWGKKKHICNQKKKKHAMFLYPLQLQLGTLADLTSSFQQMSIE